MCNLYKGFVTICTLCSILQSKVATVFLPMDACYNLFLRTFCAKPKTKHGKSDHGLLEEFNSSRLLWLCSKIRCGLDSSSTEHQLSSD